MHAFFAALGRFSVRYRWVILAVWILGTAAAVDLLPSLGSVVNSNNTAFLPSNAPDVRAANLAAPLGGKENLEPLAIVAYRADGQVTPADIAAIQREAVLAHGVVNVRRVQFVGISSDHKSIQLAALADVAGFSPLKAEDTVNALDGHVYKGAGAGGAGFLCRRAGG